MAHASEYLTAEDLNRYIVDSDCVAENLAKIAQIDRSTRGYRVNHHNNLYWQEGARFKRHPDHL
jgi:hypothetical protein